MTSVSDIVAFLDAAADPAGSQRLDASIEGPATIDGAGPSQVAFCSASAPRALERALGTHAGLALVDTEVLDRMDAAGLTATVVIRCERARLDFARVVSRFFAPPAPPPGVHPSAVVAADAKVSPEASIGPLCTIAAGVVVGEGCVLHAGVHLYGGVRLGSRVTVHSGSVIGADGFGYERDAGGELVRLPHTGGVVIEDDVEIGSNTAIDRGAIEDTVICSGARIDNLVHIAHNVRVGAGAAVIAHAMVAGSVSLGERSWVAPAAVIRDGIAVGADAAIGLGSVVTRDVPPGETVLGVPARPLHEHRRFQEVVRGLAAGEESS